MKKIIFIIFAAIMSATVLWSQTRVYQNPDLLKYIQGGASKDGILELSVKPGFSSLSVEEQNNLLNFFFADFPNSKIVVRISKTESQLWIPQQQGYVFASDWNIDNLPLADYKPLELNKYGNSRFFYYVGGSLSGSGGMSSGMVNLRGGSFLYKEIWDISASLGLGFSGSSDEKQFIGDIGIMTRAYLPWRIPKVNLAPYAGVGASLSFAPETVFEGQLLAGCSWFVGPGSFDVGFKYGIQSGFSMTFGYTFRPSLRIKK